MQPTIFHLAFPINNIAKAKQFYVLGLGCQVGRENSHSIILNLRGHQIVGHMTKDPLTPQRGIYPRHFGLIFTVEEDWEALLERSQQQNLTFYETSKERFVGSPLEHRTFFLEDPFHNLLEFKFYRYPAAIFGEAEFAQVGDRTHA
ncbi:MULTISPECIES: VOC family protein [unclassified Leptolyngbya]|uniref:VOC family protein n=1 Tax=unclassified Leptolyngbya TaxID=2650499 RepID=UPI001685CB1A|nr:MULTISPECIES: VOC family protein [unclassified Leptolyngbya]MBD1909610.1 VOC family protein [Leptolyngbya sp. FACHB-8]MBD2154148.1 VOC family protein [Leptolyngbya sp. FACHB-16]